MLLDAVLSATDAVVLTYSGRDLRTNEELPPAVPVNELLDALDLTVQAADGRPIRDHVVHHHPLQPTDPRAFAPGGLGVDGPWSYDDVLLAGAVAARSAPRPSEPFLPRPLAPAAPREVVPLEDLVQFVQHPTQAFLRQRLGPLRASVPGSRLDAGRGEVARHRGAHDPGAEDRCGLHGFC